jgi:predicted permease
MPLVRRIANLFLRSRVDREIDTELQSHIDLRIDDNLAAGMTPDEARRDAILRFGNPTATRERVAGADLALSLEGIWADIRFAIRVLRKSPGFTLAATMTLALAIGANAVVFSVMNAFILRPLNVPNAQSLYGLWRTADSTMYESYPDYLDLRARNHSFEDIVAYSVAEVGLDTGDNPIRAWAIETSANYFDALGLQPALGHFYHNSDERGPNSAPYIVLSYTYWKDHFQSDPGVVGRVVKLNQHPYTIIGVGPPGYHGTLLFFNPDFFVPMINHAQFGTDDMNARRERWIFMTMGHLKAGVTPAQAAADLSTIGADLEKRYPKDEPKMAFTLERPGLYGDYLGRPARAFLAGLMLLASLILLAACANLGSLFAARAADRSREIALRLALGSSRSRILRGLFTEALLISLAGGAVGLAFSVALLHGLSVWQPIPRWPIQLSVEPDGKVYLVALLLALLSGLLFAAVPVRQVLRSSPYEVVKAGSSGRVGRRLTVRDLLLVVQIAICAVLVTASMVAVRGLARSLHHNFGFALDDTILIETDLSMTGYSGDRVAPMQQRMVDAVLAIPGVQSVGLADTVPMSAGSFNSEIFRDETTDFRPSNAATDSFRYKVSPQYFHAAGTTLLSGRTFTSHDDSGSPRVAVVNLEFTRKVFGSETGALGRHFKLPDGARFEVVGVVEDGKYAAITEDPQPALFLSILQSPSTSTILALHCSRDPLQLAPILRTRLRALDAGLPLYIETRYAAIDSSLFAPRIAAISLGVMGVLGAMLSVTGIFGMAAYSVSKRMKEFGIRVALGAGRKEVLQSALGRAFKLLAYGSLAGMALGVLAAPVLAYIVDQATPLDPVVLAGVVLAMALLGLVATWIPAQRALAANPMSLLREE